MKNLASLAALAAAILAVAATSLPANAANIPPKHKPSPTTYDCGSDLGYLRRVYEEEIADVEDVSIVPICENDDYGLMRSEGNAGAIRAEIADNSDIMDALDLANFRVDDVVAVRMTGDESAVIYVHTFHYR